MMDKTAYLVLADGTIYKGRRFGADGNVIAEVVFNTGMTGYLETLTDPANFGQAIVQTFPLSGNYGVIAADLASERVQCAAFIVREWCPTPSNFRCEGNIDTFLKEQGTVGLYGIDTRALVRRLREFGVMNGCITDDPASVDMDALRAYTVRSAVAEQSCKDAYTVNAENGKYNVTLIDYGVSAKLVKTLVGMGCNVTVVPYNTSAADILAAKPDGIVLSDGHGDPAENTNCIAVLRELIGSGTAMFGIGLGHLMLALAAGFKTEKLRYGHHGANQPARDLKTGRIYITSQNHGYVVVSDSIDASVAEIALDNSNDHTCEGISYKSINATTVQFFPETGFGPQNASYLFDQFLTKMNTAKEGK